MDAILALEHVSRRFGAVTVADDVCLRLAPGEALGVIGPNGAGKTTLFNLVAGAVRPDRGRIFLGGEDITRLPGYERCRRGLARSFQIPQPFVGMTVAENLLVGAAFGHGRAAAGARPRRGGDSTPVTAVPDLLAAAAATAEDRCRAILERTGLASRADVLAGRLTLLERKRLELARALAASPRVLLLDEIAGGLTESECHRLVEVIEEIRRAGIALVWIEHVVHALLAVASRLVVLNFGRLIAEGEPREVMRSRVVREIYLGVEPDAI